MDELDISFGKHKEDTNWKVHYLSWPEFVDKLRKVRRTTETMADYDKMDKAAQGRAKDGPAFVGGFIRGGRRLKGNVESRSLITLDADFADDGFSFDVELILGGRAYVIYSTHSHRPHQHKYRLIIPTDRLMTPDEYLAASRKLAELIGMSYFDGTTFQVQRLMFLPSCSKDAEPTFEESEGEALSVDWLLGQYNDWTNVAEWPRHPKEKKGPNTHGQKAQDPREKQGTIGVFCRTYSMEEAIETFLADVYETGTMPNRYTYLAGTSANGLEVYPDQELAFSHQDSDPAADGRTHNAFDLVRIHKFGHLDEKVSPNTPDAKRPSFMAMEVWASKQDAVKKTVWQEKQAEFAEFEEEEVEDVEWETKLEYDRKNNLLATPGNVELILSNGEWKGVLAYDAFGNTETVRKPLPWRGMERSGVTYEPWLGADDKRLRHWIGKKYGIKGGNLIMDALTEVTRQNSFHPIKEYVESAEWDGEERMERIFIDYMGALDTHYVRQATRKMMIAAVARVYEPGCKFDQMLVLIGPQGKGKSSLLAKLGRRWFSDSLKSFENKEAGEHLQNGWIFEIGELSVMKKSAVEEVKAFLSKTEDRYRVAYDRQVSEFPRKCVFFGTTNNREFLHDPTGNRRFWPVEIAVQPAKYYHPTDLTDDIVEQIWAEALHAYRSGESLLLDDLASETANVHQVEHLEIDPREGIVHEWLDGEDEDEMGRPTGEKRSLTCALQVWIECLGGNKKEFNAWEAKNICNMLRSAPGWEELPSRRVVPGYGKQTAFKRVSKGQ